MVMILFVVIWACLVLSPYLLAPFLAPRAARFLGSRAGAGGVLKALGAWVALVAAAWAFDVSFQAWHANAAAFGAAYLALAIVAMSVRGGRLGAWTRRSADLLLPLGAGVAVCLLLVSPGAFLIIPEFFPSRQESMPEGLRCKVYVSGNLTSSNRGYRVKILRPMPILSSLERELYEAHFDQPGFGEESACDRARVAWRVSSASPEHEVAPIVR
jgi:hypothetical protein